MTVDTCLLSPHPTVRPLLRQPLNYFFSGTQRPPRASPRIAVSLPSHPHPLLFSTNPPHRSCHRRSRNSHSHSQFPYVPTIRVMFLPIPRTIPIPIHVAPIDNDDVRTAKIPEYEYTMSSFLGLHTAWYSWLYIYIYYKSSVHLPEIRGMGWCRFGGLDQMGWGSSPPYKPPTVLSFDSLTLYYLYVVIVVLHIFFYHYTYIYSLSFFIIFKFIYKYIYGFMVNEPFFYNLITKINSRKLF